MHTSVDRRKLFVLLLTAFLIGISIDNILPWILRTNSVSPLEGNPIEQQIPKTIDLTDSADNVMISWHGINDMHKIITRYWRGNPFCEEIDKVRLMAANRNLPITLNITFGCREIYEKSVWGSGNYVALLYGVRLVGHVYNDVNVYFSCYDANETKKELILPWLTGWFPSRPKVQKSAYPISIQDVCKNYSSQPLSLMYNEMQDDLRYMAIRLFGASRSDHPSKQFAEEKLQGNHYKTETIPDINVSKENSIPLYSLDGDDLDDAVIHFRCGDLMDSEHRGFSFMKFNGYAKHISIEAQSIGIITQPFDQEVQVRKIDFSKLKRERCRVVVYSLVEYIQKRFPNARVIIRNNSNETIATAYARMVMANQTIVGISSFGAVPAVATFGKGYIPSPDYVVGPNKWLLNPRIDKMTSSVVLYDEPNRMQVSKMKELWSNEGEKGVLKWFSADTIPTSTSV